MRTGLLIGRTADGACQIICDPSVAVEEQRKRCKKIAVAGGEGLAVVELWESGSGIVKRLKFSDSISPQTAGKRRKRHEE